MPIPLRHALSALALFVTTLVAASALGAASAHAAAVVDIDPNATATLHIHKFEQPATPGAPGTGEATDTTGLTPIAGVTFTVQRVNGIDLTTNAGWQQASQLTPAQAAAQAKTPGRTGVTNASGDVDFTGLPLGLYLVTETGYPAGVTPSAPFLVTLPLTDPTHTDNWLYDVHVYPKNAVTTAGKTVADANAVALGDDVVWTINADIPRVQNIDAYRIVDKLDQRLDYKSTTVELTNGPSLTSTDYTIAFDSATNTVTVDFTAAGRAILAANPDARVKVTITTKANATGTITNEALVYPNEESTQHQPGEPGGPVVTAPVETRWGVIVIEKQDADNSATLLPGAEFQVFTSEADARAQTNPISIDGVDTWTTGSNGQAVISGLRYSNYADGQDLQPGDPNYRSYWLVETKAPSGYELLAEPVKVDVTSSDATAVTLDVKDVATNAGFAFPLTGGAGTTIFTGLGVLLLVVGAVYLIRVRRSEA